MIKQSDPTPSALSSVAGKGFSSQPLPLWVRLARNVVALLAASSILLLIVYANQWSWLTDGINAKQSLWAAAALLSSSAVFLILRFTSLMHGFLGIRLVGITSTQKSKTKLVYGGYRSPFAFVMLALLSAGLAFVVASETSAILKDSPLPQSITRESVTVAASPQNLMPVHFWDYALIVNPEQLADFDIVLPYEKGPPQKLIGRLALVHRATGTTALELHGKRPRSYEEKFINDLFPFQNQEQLDPVTGLRTGRDLAVLSKEAGINWNLVPRQNHKILSLIRLELPNGEVTSAVGLPWNDPVKRFFFWGPGGSVFQVRCGRSKEEPCLFNAALANARFALDPKASLSERKAWTTTRIQTLLQELAGGKEFTPSEKERQKTLISLYLVSLLTLDPRDPEAYFHLGKLAHNRETVVSAIRYGRDVGLSSEKLAELQAEADK